MRGFLSIPNAWNKIEQCSFTSSSSFCSLRFAGYQSLTTYVPKGSVCMLVCIYSRVKYVNTLLLTPEQIIPEIIASFLLYVK